MSADLGEPRTQRVLSMRPKKNGLLRVAFSRANGRPRPIRAQCTTSAPHPGRVLKIHREPIHTAQARAPPAGDRAEMALRTAVTRHGFGGQRAAAARERTARTGRVLPAAGPRVRGAGSQETDPIAGSQVPAGC